VRLDSFLEQLATAERAPGAGSAAALTIAFAASLVAMVARSSVGSWPEAGGVSAQALAIADRSAPLAPLDADAWEAAAGALRAASSGEEQSAGGLEAALDRAAAIPLELAELGADVAALATLAAEHCEPAYRADAAAAAALAAGATRAAAHLVEVNLTVHHDDQRLARALASADVASDHAGRALASIR
jgi:formiminotetrahydrofolate cyclodeaminase